MRRLLSCLWLALLLIGGAPAVQAQTFPKFTGLVVDDANVLPPATRAELTQKLEALQKDTKRQLVVATIGDLQGYPLEDYGNRLLRTWGAGLKNANNGAILFIAPNNPVGQRGPRLEVGYGLEPILTDAFASTVTKGLMTPMLRNKDTPGAMTAGTDAVIAQLRASPEEAQAKVDAAVKEFDQRQRSGDGFPVAGVFMLIVVGVIVASIFSGRRRRRQAGPWGRPHRSSDGGVMPIVLWSIADEIARNASRGSGWSGGGGSGWGGGSSDGGSSGGWGDGGFTGGGGGSGGGGGASGDW